MRLCRGVMDIHTLLSKKLQHWSPHPGNNKVAIKKIHHIFSTLSHYEAATREIKLLRLFDYSNLILKILYDSFPFA